MPQLSREGRVAAARARHRVNPARGVRGKSGGIAEWIGFRGQGATRIPVDLPVLTGGVGGSGIGAVEVTGRVDDRAACAGVFVEV